MPDNPFLFNPPTAAPRRALVTPVTAAPKPAELVFVDISKKSKRADIVREGFHVPETRVVPGEFERFLGEVEVQRPKEAPRVVGQSIAPGQKVRAGTAVDLVMIPASDVPLRIFEGVHEDLRQRSVGLLLEQTFDRSENRNALRIVLAKQAADDLSDAEKQAVDGVLQQADVGIDPADPGRDFGSAYRALRYAAAYK